MHQNQRLETISYHPRTTHIDAAADRVLTLQWIERGVFLVNSIKTVLEGEILHGIVKVAELQVQILIVLRDCFVGKVSCASLDRSEHRWSGIFVDISLGQEPEEVLFRRVTRRRLLSECEDLESCTGVRGNDILLVVSRIVGHNP